MLPKLDARCCCDSDEAELLHAVVPEPVERKRVQRPASNRRINGPECCRQFLACITCASLPAQQVKLENIPWSLRFARRADAEAERVHASVLNAFTCRLVHCSL